jgi:hypothetical protein
MIDIDKFICSYLSILEKCKEHTKGIEGLKISGRYQLIIDLLNQQGIIYKDGSLIKIGSKKCEGKLKEMLNEKVLANSCESSKVEEWFMCKHDWKAIDNEIIFEKGKVYHISHPWLGNVINFADYFRPATEEEINREVGNSDIPQRMVSAKAKEEAVRIAREEVIEKACEWLNNFYSEGRHCFLVKEDIEAFKQAMEKGE